MNLIPTLAQQPEPSLRRAVLGWLMRIANRKPLLHWYDNKALLLEFYGEKDGFDLQTIAAECWECDGEGCPACDWDGIHHTTRTILTRRRVGGCIFHTPGRAWWLEDYADLIARPGFRRHITRRIKHRPCDPRAAREAVALILLLTGHYQAWWRAITYGGPHVSGTVAFPTVNTGFYPQHLLAKAIHTCRLWLDNDADLPF
jgi:hypothetical protein